MPKDLSPTSKILETGAEIALEDHRGREILDKDEWGIMRVGFSRMEEGVQKAYRYIKLVVVYEEAESERYKTSGGL